MMAERHTPFPLQLQEGLSLPILIQHYRVTFLYQGHDLRPEKLLCYNFLTKAIQEKCSMQEFLQQLAIQEKCSMQEFLQQLAIQEKCSMQEFLQQLHKKHKRIIRVGVDNSSE